MIINADIHTSFLAVSVKQTDNYQILNNQSSNKTSPKLNSSEDNSNTSYSYTDTLDLSATNSTNHVSTENKKCTCGKCPACLHAKNSKEEEQEIIRLKQRDAKVKTHEQAHVSAGASSPSYKYKTGSDGERYAVSGHANIETSKESTPEQTIQKAQSVKRAALAPADPSGQDRKVASQADKMEIEAKQELQEETSKESEKLDDDFLESKTLVKQTKTNNMYDYADFSFSQGKKLDFQA